MIVAYYERLKAYVLNYNASCVQLESDFFASFLRGYSTPGPYFWRFCEFSQKIKKLWTKYPTDLIRNVPRKSKITVLFH